MSTETKPSNLTGYIPPGAIERAAGVTQYMGQRLVEKIIIKTSVERPYGFDVSFVGAAVDGYLPIIVSNHASHADGAAVSKLTRHLTNLFLMYGDAHFRGYNMPLAISLLTGHQGWFLRMGYHYAEAPMENNHLFALPLVREKDHEKYGMKLGMREKGEYLVSLRKRVEEGYLGIVLFPEGTTEGGKTEGDGSFKGMQPFEEGSIAGHVGRLKKYSGRKIMIIPIAITGGHQVINSNTKGIPIQSVLRILDLSMFRIKVGGVIREDDRDFSEAKKPGEVDRLVGRRIAQLLPAEMRGVYA